ncbi:cation-translocating P-type ATPase [Rhodococcus wratislaviensis]|nr:cation-translocating P-type ATPase [Rhodococcus sp. 3A]MBC2896033.1 cation-translocating P-type ATPase [Rhodococcus sp. 4CII]
MQIADGAVGYLRTAASLPVRGAGFGLGVATYGGAVAADLVATTTRTATQLAGELMGGTPVRRTSTHHGRAWIEVRGLEGARGDDVAAGVLAAVRSLDGVDRAELNRSLSRLIVTVGASGPSVAELCTVIAGAEDRARPSVPDAAGDRSKELPGDDVTLAERSLALAAVTTGFVAALAGRLIPIPGLPWPVPAAAVTFVNYQPRLRGMVEDRLGPDAAELLLATAQAAGDVVRQAPASLAVDMVLRSAITAEAWSGRRAWRRREPELARNPSDDTDRVAIPRDRTSGPLERDADRAAVAQLVGATAVGAATRSVAGAADAALVAAPKAARTAREVFAATLGRGLADRHDVLTLRPRALRCLDRIDAVVVDPDVLHTSELRVSAIRAVRDSDRTRVWEAARSAVDAGALGAGWHALGELPDDLAAAAEDDDAAVLVTPAHHSHAAAVLAQARTSGAQVVSVDVDTLGGLRSAFDDLFPASGSQDADLRDAVAALRAKGATVAVLAVRAPLALAAADVGIGVLAADAPPPWPADLLVDDLVVAWRVLRSLPDARTASRRGVEIATASSILGALLMLPGVRGRGPGPVTVGAAAGVWTGHSLARGVLRAPAPAAAPVHAWHEMPVPDVRRLLPAREDEGIGGARRRSVNLVLGPVAVIERLTAWPVGLAWDFGRAMRTELSDPLTPVLATGSAASALLGSPVDAVLVGSVLVGNAALSAVQRLHAERLLNRLLAAGDPPAHRIVGVPEHRVSERVEASRLRPGDVIEIGPGEVVPADGRVVESAGVEVDESSLTGESLPVVKQTSATPGAPLSERACMVFAGSTVLTGTATAIVTAVGGTTEAGRAGALTPAGASHVGLQAQLRTLTDRVLPVSVGGGALVTAVGFLRGTGLRQAVTSGVAVAVAAVPEGLPLVATLAQQAAARRLTRSDALVRAPRSVEALGRVDVVCFDKTGTLSENRLRVVRAVPHPGHDREEVLACAARSAVTPDGRPAAHATDAAIAEAAADLAPEDGEHIHLPFRSGRPYSAALSGTHLSLKGAPEVVLEACAGIDADEVHDTVVGMAADGLRVIAVARRTVTPFQARRAAADTAVLDELCGAELEFVGLLGLADTPRPEAAGLLPELERLQVGVRLITGDHPVTATAITRELGLPVSAEQVISGTAWDALSHRGQENAVEKCVVFARMSPENKVQIVQTLERVGHVCAMVGDGANDAAAIRAASVGIGVSSRGSDPARSAADVVLLDGRVDALLDALDEGRQLWRRVQAGVSVLLGGNAGEVAFALVGSAIAGRSPLTARQLLLVNVLTDALPAAALAVSPPNERARGEGRGPDSAALWRTVAIRGTATAAGATTAWALASVTGRQRRASTVGLVALVGTQLGQTLIDSRSPLVVLTAGGSLVALTVMVSTPGVSQLLGCTPLGPLGWAQALGCAGAATAAAALAPGLLEKFAGDQSTISITPARSSTAYTSRSGGVSTRVTAPVNGSDAAEKTPTAVWATELSTPATVRDQGGAQGNGTDKGDER